MVDLVKIRKKKAEKKKAEEEAAAAASAADEHAASDSPVSEASAPPVAQPASAPAEAASPDAPAASPVILSPAEGEGSAVSGATGGGEGAASPRSSPESADPSSSSRLRMTGDAGSARGDAGSARGAAEAARGDARPATTTTARASTAAGDSASTSKLERFKAEAGRRRETADAAENSDGRDEVARLEALTFVIAGEQYALDIERIVEIVTPRPVTRIPNADSSVLGIMSLRGTIVTLLDVRQKLGHPPAGAPTADTRIVVIDSGSETVGFTVDRVLRVVKTGQDAIEPHPVVHAGELNEAIRGVFRTGGSLTILLDLDKLLDHNALAAAPA